MRDDDAIRTLMAEQDGLATRAQLLTLGGTDEWIEAELAARRAQRPHRKVLLGTTGPPTRRQQERAALLCAGPYAALSHQSAARRWGMASAVTEVHMTVPYGKSADTRSGVVVHRSRAFAHIVVDRSDMPTVSAPDTCVDLAVAVDDPRAAMRMLLHAALSMRVAPAAITAVLDRRPPPRYRHLLRDTAGLLDLGVDSELEAIYAVDVEDAHGLPRAHRQRPVIVGGRERYEDCLYRVPGGDLTVRLDGWRYHSDRRVALVDQARDNAAELDGRGRLTFGWEEVAGAACATARSVATALRARGWTGPTRPTSCACVPVSGDGNARTRR